MKTLLLASLLVLSGCAGGSYTLEQEPQTPEQYLEAIHNQNVRIENQLRQIRIQQIIND